MNHLTRLAIETSIVAGKAIMEVFTSNDFGLKIKSDDSPLTEADLRSHRIIDEALQTTHIPILSEEGEHLSYEERKDWDELWIVDPLDGTKEFVKRSGEFTVNIALVKNQNPVMGVVFAPVLRCLYWGDESGAYKVELPEAWMDQDINLLMDTLDIQRMPNGLPDKMTVVASVSHFSAETEQYLRALKQREGEVELVSKGSSLKMCLVAEGSAHLYPRLGPTMEWDTAAGQAVIEAAGGLLHDWNTKQAMKYNREQLLNGSFLAVAKSVDILKYWL